MTDPQSRQGDGPGLEPGDLGGDPVAAFTAWLDAARAAGADLPEAMALATASPERGPAVRMVLLRGADESGFRFFTNRESAKAADLAALPRGALCFHWMHPRQRQVRVEGRVEPLGERESAAYFATRPPGSRVSAWASPQSRVVADRAALEALWDEARRTHGDDPQLPPFWGGYLLVPDRIEFWQGRLDRLHDRIDFRRDGGAWVSRRLAP